MGTKPAWKAWRMYRTCGRKQNRYDHEGQARREAHKRGLFVYKCPYCDKWHLTSKQPEQIK